MNYIAKDVEISNSSEDHEWDDSIELAGEVLAALPEGYDYCFVAASNTNWRGQSGVTIFDLTDSIKEEFWSKVAGWSNADWTLRIPLIPAKPLTIDAVAYSHDTPTGGARHLHFLTARQVVDKLLLDGSRSRLDEVKDYFGVSTKAELYKHLQQNYAADDVKDLL